MVGGYAAVLLLEEIKIRNYHKLLARIVNAESFLASGIYNDARKIYDDVLIAAKDDASRIIYPDVVAQCNYGLGKCYQIWSADDPTAFPNAIQCYENFLEYYKNSTDDEAMEARKLETRYNLGLVYAAYIKAAQKKDYPAFLKRSELLLNGSLKHVDIITRQLFPQESPAGLQTAETKTTGSIFQALSAVYHAFSEMEFGDKAEASLLKSLGACDNALKYFTSDYATEHAGLLQRKVDTCKRICSLADTPDNVRKVIAAQKDVISFLQSNARFNDLFELYRETGDSYVHLAKLVSDAGDNDNSKETGLKALEDACAIYKEMITLYDEDRVVVVNTDIANVYQKMAEALVKRYHLDLQESYLTDAFTAFQKALGYVPDGSVEMANIQSLIGSLYVILSKHHDRKANIKEARSAYKIALKIYDSKGLVPYKQYMEASLKEIEFI